MQRVTQPHCCEEWPAGQPIENKGVGALFPMFGQKRFGQQLGKLSYPS